MCILQRPRACFGTRSKHIYSQPTLIQSKKHTAHLSVCAHKFLALAACLHAHLMQTSQVGICIATCRGNCRGPGTTHTFSQQLVLSGTHCMLASRLILSSRQPCVTMQQCQSQHETNHMTFPTCSSNCNCMHPSPCLLSCAVSDPGNGFLKLRPSPVAIIGRRLFDL
jgi:hypothetical protein